VIFGLLMTLSYSVTLRGAIFTFTKINTVIETKMYFKCFSKNGNLHLNSPSKI